MSWIYFRSADLLLLPAALLSLLLAVIVLAERRAIAGGRPLAAFFGLGALFMLLLYLELVTRDPVEQLFALAEPPIVLAGLLALGRFACDVSRLPLSRLGRAIQKLTAWSLLIATAATLVGLAQLWRTMKVPGILQQLTTLIVLGAFVACVALLLTEASRVSAGRGHQDCWDGIVPAPLVAARVLRLIALAFVLPVGLAITTFLHDALFLSARWHHSILHIGLTLFFLVLAVAYLWVLVPGRRLAFGLIICILVPLLLALGLAGSQRIEAARAEYLRAALYDIEALRHALPGQDQPLDLTAIPPGVGYLAVLQPVARIHFARDPAIAQALLDPQEPIFARLPYEERVRLLQRANPQLDADQARIIAYREALVREDTLFHGRRFVKGATTATYHAHRFWLNGALYEVGFDYIDLDTYVTQSLAPYMAAMLGATLLIGGIAIRVRLRPTAP